MGEPEVCNEQLLPRSDFAGRAPSSSIPGGRQAGAGRAPRSRHQQRPGDDAVQYWGCGDDGRRAHLARLLSRLQRLLQRQEDGRERLSGARALGARPALDPCSIDRKRGQTAGPLERDASAPRRDAVAGDADRRRSSELPALRCAGSNASGSAPPTWCSEHHHSSRPTLAEPPHSGTNPNRDDFGPRVSSGN